MNEYRDLTDNELIEEIAKHKSNLLREVSRRYISAMIELEQLRKYSEDARKLNLKLAKHCERIIKYCNAKGYDISEILPKVW